MAYWLDLFGVAVFAVTGAMAAGQKRMDIFGVMVLATVTAIGGGSLRDILLGVTPVVWVRHDEYLYVIMGAALVTMAYQHRFRFFEEKSLAYFDAFGLALFAVLGAEKAFLLGHSIVVCMVMGVLTAVFGGVLRDTISDKFPLIFRRDIYATCAVLASGVYVIMMKIGCKDPVALSVGLVAGLGLRLAAIHWHLSLPVFSLDKHKGPNS